MYINDCVKPITPGDFDELIENYENIDLWKEKFLPHSYTLKGFIISNIFDVTEDQSLSNFKCNIMESIL